MAHRLASSNNLTRYASAASWRHSIAADWNRRSVLKSWAISLTSLWKGSFRISSAVLPLVVADVFQSHSSRSVPVGFYPPPLHPCLVDLSLLLSRPVQYTVAQLSSLLGARDIEGWQLTVDRGVCLWLSCVVLCEPLVSSVVRLHSPSSCVCWGRHRHHRRHDLTSCLWNRLHHLYLGRRPRVHRSRRC